MSTWADPAAFARTVQAAYRRNKWAGAAHAGPRRLREGDRARHTRLGADTSSRSTSCRSAGYAGPRGVHELAQLAPIAQPGRFLDSQKLLLVSYLGDHDPSGRGMSDCGPPDTPVPVRERRPLRRRLDRRGGRVGPGRLWDRRPGASPSPSRTRWRSATGLGFPASDKVKDSRYRWFVEHLRRSVLGTRRDEPQRPSARASRPRFAPSWTGPRGSGTWPPSAPNGSRSRARSGRGRAFPG